MSAGIWNRYYQYGCVSFAQGKYGDAVREFGKALSVADRMGDSSRLVSTARYFEEAKRLAKGDRVGIAKPIDASPTFAGEIQGNHAYPESGIAIVFNATPMIVL